MSLKWTRASALAVLALAGPAAASAGAAGTTRVSVSGTEAQGDAASQTPAISADGRYVAFASGARNFSGSGTSPATLDVYVRDALLGTTELVSTQLGLRPNASSDMPAISADGNFVAFSSQASNLVPGDTNDFADVLLRDRAARSTERVSISTGGVQGDAISFAPSVSADGRFVAFTSMAGTLAPGGVSGVGHIFVRDRQTATTGQVDVSSAELPAGAASNGASISADGRYVAFGSNATNLVPGDTNGYVDAFVRDLQAGTTERVSVDSAEHQVTFGGVVPSISADGRYVEFTSDSSNLVAGDTNAAGDVFVRDRVAGTTERVSVSSAEVQGDSTSGHAAISGDGRIVAFDSFASNLVTGDSNAVPDAFVRDRVAGVTERVSVANAGTQGNDLSLRSVVSGGGRFVAFESEASNLVAADTNAGTDVFVRDRGATGSAYAAGVLAGGPVGYWRLGETAGTTAVDASARHNNGTYLNAPTLRVPGALLGDANTAVSFDGVNDSVRVADSASLDVGDTFTLEAWVKRTSDTSSIELFNKGAGGLQVVLMSAANGNQVWLRKAGVSTLARSTTGVPFDGEFHHIVVLKSGPYVPQINIDGIEAGTVTLALIPIANTASPLTITGGGSAPHVLDELAIYPRRLSPNELIEHLRARLGTGT